LRIAAILRTIRHVADGNNLQKDFLSDLADVLPDSRVRDRLLEVHSESLTLADYAREFGTTGFVADAVPAAIVAAVEASDLIAMIRNIVNCGGDTDTISSMAGQILGALRGVHGLPNGMVDHLDIAPVLRDTASQLSEMSKRWPTRDK
jgi:ADP-ribosylglycohydrolase